jgi:hypothetical protein
MVKNRKESDKNADRSGMRMSRRGDMAKCRRNSNSSVGKKECLQNNNHRRHSILFFD